MGELEDIFQTKLFLGKEISLSIKNKIHTGIIYQTEYNPNIYELLEEKGNEITATKIGKQLKLTTETIEAKTCEQPKIYNKFSKNHLGYETRKEFINSNQKK